MNSRKRFWRDTLLSRTYSILCIVAILSADDVEAKVYVVIEIEVRATELEAACHKT